MILHKYPACLGTALPVLFSLGISLLLTAGCLPADPWNTAERIPSTSSAFHSPSEKMETPPGRKFAGGEKKKGPVSLPQAVPLTLADCIHTALEQNPETAVTWQAMRSAAARAGEERASWLPAADLRAEAGRGKTVSLDSDRENDTRDVYAYGIDVSWLLFDGGARQAAVKGAEAALQEAGFRHNTILQDVALAVEKSYYKLLGSKWLLKVALDTVKRTRYQLELAEARYKAGAVTRADVLRAETQRGDAELLLVQARNSVHMAHGTLAGNMGLPVYHAFEIAELPDDIKNSELPRIEQLLNEAASQRPELQAALARIEANRAEVAAEQAAWWPTLRFGASAGRKDTTFTPDQNEWALGLSLNFPFFDGFRRSYRTRRALANLAQAMAEHASILQGIELEVWNA